MSEYPIILIVEDNPDHFQLMSRALRRELSGGEVFWAENAGACHKTLQEIQPDLIVLDYSLPDVDGLELLKDLEEEGCRVPIVMVTGQGNEKVAVEAMKLGAVDYVIKSENYLTTLPHTVINALENARVRLRLKEQELYYRDLVENATDCIYLLDEAGKIRMVNRASTRLTGYRKRELIGKHFSVLFEEREYRKLLNRVLKRPRFRRVDRLETRIIGKGGESIPVEVSVLPVRQRQKVIGYQGIVRDIRDRIQHEEELKRRSEEIERMNRELRETNRRLQAMDSMKTQFVSNVSHELRTPLNAILGYAELLKEGLYGKMSDAQKEALDHIIASGNYLLNLINQLLDFALIHNDKLKMYKEACSVYSIADAAISTIRPAAEQKELRLRKYIAPNLPRVVVDGQKIFQVLLNLLSNAVKFTEQGDISLRIRQKDSYIEFVVEDSGIGIDPADFDKIFEDFQQVSGGMSRKYGGAGLGLSLAKHFVRMHGGQIWVESVPGKGSAFHFTIPVEEGEGTAEQSKDGMEG